MSDVEERAPGEERVRMVVTDFDGTLYHDGRIDEKDIRALKGAGNNGVVTALATGRSLFSLRRTLGERELPVDFLILSTGIGVIHQRSDRAIRSAVLRERTANTAIRALMRMDVDFTVHREFPDNHRFSYYRSATRSTPDLIRRIELYRGFCEPLNADSGFSGQAAQLVAVCGEEEGESILSRVTGRLAESLSVVRTTSPLDGRSLWIEMLPMGVSKGSCVEWLAGSLGIERELVVALGNDYNDSDMLKWAGRSFVVDGAPDALAASYENVPAGGGVAEALGKLEPR